MPYLFNLIYLLLLAVYLPVVWYQRTFRGKSRPGLWQKFTGNIPRRSGSARCVWFHAVSLGEVNALQPLIQRFQLRHPEWSVVFSTTTQTGFDAARKLYPECQLVFFPFDFTWAVRNFVRRIRPDLLVLAELEIWPNLLRECKNRNVSTALVNARLSEKSFGLYSRFFAFLGSAFQNLDLICVQNETYAKRFIDLAIGQERVQMTGNLKFDSLISDRQIPKIRELRALTNVSESNLVFVAGSTQAPEEQIAIDTFLSLHQEFPHLRLFLCPRHPERFDEVAELLKANQIKATRRSEINDQIDAVDCERVVLLDTMGELRYWWGVADIAFVGGSFGNRGGQNMIEAAAIGAAVCFGPNTQNFASEVEWLTSNEAAVQLGTPADLTEHVRKCCQDHEFRTTLICNARKVFSPFENDELKNATQRTLDELEKVMEMQSSRDQVEMAA